MLLVVMNAHYGRNENNYMFFLYFLSQLCEARTKRQKNKVGQKDDGSITWYPFFPTPSQPHCVQYRYRYVPYNKTWGNINQVDLFFEKNINKLHISFISKIMMCSAILCCHSDIKDAFKKMYSMRILCTQCEKGMMLCTHGAGCGWEWLPCF